MFSKEWPKQEFKNYPKYCIYQWKRCIYLERATLFNCLPGNLLKYLKKTEFLYIEKIQWNKKVMFSSKMLSAFSLVHFLIVWIVCFLDFTSNINENIWISTYIFLKTKIVLWIPWIIFFFFKYNREEKALFVLLNSMSNWHKSTALQKYVYYPAVRVITVDLIYGTTIFK